MTVSDPVLSGLAGGAVVAFALFALWLGVGFWFNVARPWLSGRAA